MHLRKITGKNSVQNIDNTEIDQNNFIFLMAQRIVMANRAITWIGRSLSWLTMVVLWNQKTYWSGSVASSTVQWSRNLDPSWTCNSLGPLITACAAENTNLETKDEDLKKSSVIENELGSLRYKIYIEKMRK